LSSPTWWFLNEMCVLDDSDGTDSSRLVEMIFPRLRQRSTEDPSSYLEIEGRICGAAGVATSLGGFGFLMSCVLLSLDLLEVWPIARTCSRERRLSEYARVGAREELPRGIEKIRKVVMPSASPRVGANLEAILNDSVIDVRQYGTMCRCNAQAVMINMYRSIHVCSRGGHMQ
jgi:hypothetical protein